MGAWDDKCIARLCFFFESTDWENCMRCVTPWPRLMPTIYYYLLLFFFRWALSLYYTSNLQLQFLRSVCLCVSGTLSNKYKFFSLYQYLQIALVYWKQDAFCICVMHSIKFQCHSNIKSAHIANIWAIKGSHYFESISRYLKWNSVIFLSHN